MAMKIPVLASNESALSGIITKENIFKANSPYDISETIRNFNFENYEYDEKYNFARNNSWDKVAYKIEKFLFKPKILIVI